MPLEKKTQIIVYIGRKPIKHDTVAGTGLIWAGYGDSHEVRHTEAVMLLQHPDVWATASKFNQLQGKVQAISVGAGLTAVSASDSSSNDDEMIDTDELQKATPPAKDDEGSRSLSVQEAIRSLDRSNPEHFSGQTGNPIIKAVREAAGDSNISLKDVNAAWAAIKAGEE